jgi:hypothetical protein
MEINVEIVSRWIHGFHFLGTRHSLRVSGNNQREKKKWGCRFHDPCMISADAGLRKTARHQGVS